MSSRSCCCFGSSPRKKINLQRNSSFEGLPSEKNIKLFSYGELKDATCNFDRGSRIGRGGFGTVYKGILKNERAVAVKVLSAESRQGTKEFLTEIDVISNVRHPNLVELIGCCVQGSSRILVYEFLENGSLDQALLGFGSEAGQFTWSIRASICLGVARGLAFLHEHLEPPIVHRDIKASNILLDRSYGAKIGDFGLAKLFPDNLTHISTRVAGTAGYLAPEYAWHGQLTKKADIYSFGVLVLEIISGRSSSKSVLSADERLLLQRTWDLYKEERLLELLDPVLTERNEEEVLRYAKVALFCTQAAAARRPSMPQVVEMLSRPIRLNEEELTAPGYISDYQSLSRGLKETTPSRSRWNNRSSGEETVTTTAPPTAVSAMAPR